MFTGEPGNEHRETLATASEAAAAGGVTTMIVMPNTSPVIDDAAIVDFILRRARDNAIVRVAPMAALTKGLAGERLTEIGTLKEAVPSLSPTETVRLPMPSYSAVRSPMPMTSACSSSSTPRSLRLQPV